jgi:Uma2 family endonuclease
MSTVKVPPPSRHLPPLKVLPRVPRKPIRALENGDELSAAEFMRRYEAMPELKKAELIDGVVYMGSPVRIDVHGEPDGDVYMLLAIYAAATPGVKAAINSTVKLNLKNIPQPDSLMRVLPKYGGKSKVEHGYLNGPPELVVEIAASSVSRDAHLKLEAYRHAEIPEYLLCLIENQKVRWLSLEDGLYSPLPQDKNGIVRSRIFPGLWLDTKALFAGNSAKLLATLQRGLKSKEHSAFVKHLAR